VIDKVSADTTLFELIITANQKPMLKYF